MAESAAPTPGRIFISYRREETAYPAGWLYDRLTGHFGGQVFKDVDSIQLGDDFVEVITTAVGSCDVLLALIGDQWLAITDARGRRRLDDPDDFVRLEIEAALTRNVRVIPILVEGARMPRADELPPSLARLVRRQALELSPARFDFDTSRLLKVLDKTLAEMRTAHDSVAAVSAPAGKAPDPSTTQPPTAPEQWERAEPSPTPSIPSTPATRPTVRPPSDESKPPDRSTTKIHVASEKREPAESSPVSSIPPVAPAAPAAAPPPSGQSQPPVKQRRRLSGRARILAGAGAGVALISLIAVVVTNLGESVIFEDDFSSQEYGWDVDSDSVGIGDYTNDAYRISAEPDSDGSFSWGLPLNASAVYPSAPPSLGIDVMIVGSSPDTRYGVLCRVAETESFYAFIIENESVSIVRHESGDTKQLATGTAPADAAGGRNLTASCDGDEEQTYVYLQLLVNGEQVAEWTDEDPLLAGTVGLFASTDTTKAVEVDFDDFVVTNVA